MLMSSLTNLLDVLPYVALKLAIKMHKIANYKSCQEEIT
jgi:hypothetical protein